MHEDKKECCTKARSNLKVCLKQVSNVFRLKVESQLAVNAMETIEACEMSLVVATKDVWVDEFHTADTQ